MPDRTLAQDRAAYTLALIMELKAQGSYGKYVSYVKALPASILTNGLGQATATLLAQGDTPHKLLYAHLSDWLCGSHDHMPYRGVRAGLMSAIISHDLDHYLQAQVEALAVLEWLKKFAVAYLDQNGQGEK